MLLIKLIHYNNKEKLPIGAKQLTNKGRARERDRQTAILTTRQTNKQAENGQTENRQAENEQTEKNLSIQCETLYIIYIRRRH